MGSLKGLISLWDLLFPRRCKACDLPLFRAEHTFCTRCAIHFPLTGFAQQADNPIVRIFYGKVRIQFASALFFFEKGRPYQHVIHAIKYKGDLELAYTMGLRLGESIKQSLLYGELDVLVPVPLHEHRQKQRGYNQSEEIAKGIAAVLQLPISNALVRVVETTSQTKKARVQRADNVIHAFEWNFNDEWSFKNQSQKPMRVLLIDDVITTGATLEACAKSLYQHNCEIYIAALAYAL